MIYFRKKKIIKWIDLFGNSNPSKEETKRKWLISSRNYKRISKKKIRKYISFSFKRNILKNKKSIKDQSKRMKKIRERITWNNLCIKVDRSMKITIKLLLIVLTLSTKRWPSYKRGMIRYSRDRLKLLGRNLKIVKDQLSINMNIQ